MAMYRASKEYKEGAASLSTYKIACAKHSILNFLRSYYRINLQQNELNTTKISLYHVINEDTSIAELIADDSVTFEKDIEFSLYKEFLRRIVNETIENLKRKSYTKRGNRLKHKLFFDIVEYYYNQAFQGKECYFSEVAKVFNITREIVRKYITEFREALQKTALDYENISEERGNNGRK